MIKRETEERTVDASAAGDCAVCADGAHRKHCEQQRAVRHC